MKTAEQVFATNRAGLHVPANVAVRDLYLAAAERAVPPELEERITEEALDDAKIDATVEQVYKFLHFTEFKAEDDVRVSETGTINVDPQILSSFVLKNLTFNKKRLADIKEFSRSPGSRYIHRIPLLGKLTTYRLVTGRHLGVQWSETYEGGLAGQSIISLSEYRQGV